MTSKQGGKHFIVSSQSGNWQEKRKFPHIMLAKALLLLAPQHHHMSLFFALLSDNVKVYFLNLPFLVTSSLHLNNNLFIVNRRPTEDRSPL